MKILCKNSCVFENKHFSFFIFFQIDFFGYISRRYGDEGKRLYKKHEALRKKQEKTVLDLEFLNKCKTYNVFPKFLRFKLYRRSLQNSGFYKSWLTKLLNNEIRLKRKTVKSLELSVTSSYNFIILRL